MFLITIYAFNTLKFYFNDVTTDMIITNQIKT